MKLRPLHSPMQSFLCSMHPRRPFGVMPPADAPPSSAPPAPRRHCRLLGPLCVLGFLLAVLVPAMAEDVAVPELLNYQGRLETLDSAKAYTNGLYDIEFRIYDRDSAGTLLWGERYSVWVKDGRFNVVLGRGGAALSGGKWSTLRDVFRMASGATDRFLGITVLQDENHNTTQGSESYPRQQLLTAPFAFQSQYAQYASQAPDNTTFQAPNGLTVAGGKALLQGGVESTDGLTVTGGPTVLSGSLTTSGSAVLSGGLVVTNKLAVLANGLDVSGKTTLHGDATAAGDVTLDKSLTVSGSATVSGRATVSGGASISGGATVNGATTVSGGALQVSANSDRGLRFPDNAFGGTSDYAHLTYYRKTTGTEDGVLELAVGNDPNDTLVLQGGGVEVHGQVSMMSGWQARDIGTTYIESTDGFVLFYGYSGHLVLHIDDNDDTASYYLDLNMYFTTGGADTAFGTFPVKKGTAWKVDKGSNNPDYWHLRWMPLGL